MTEKWTWPIKTKISFHQNIFFKKCIIKYRTLKISLKPQSINHNTEVVLTNQRGRDKRPFEKWAKEELQMPNIYAQSHF